MGTYVRNGSPDVPAREGALDADRAPAHLSEKSPTFWIQYHADQDLGRLCEFWGGAVDVDPASIRTQRKSNSNQLTGRMWRSRQGVLTVRTCDTRFRARLQAWMDHLRDGWQ